MSIEVSKELEWQNREITRLVQEATQSAIGISREDYDKGEKFTLSTAGGKVLNYYGAHHTKDIGHPQFTDIQARFYETFNGIPQECNSGIS